MECAERDETFINEYFDDTFGLEDKGLVDQFGQMNREELETIGEVVHTASHSSHVKTVRGTNTSTTLPGPVEELPPEEVMRYFQGKGYKWQAKERRFFNPANFLFSVGRKG
jgi:hypothetical protein